MKTVIRKFICRNREFTIIKDENDWYCAIEDKHITDGKLNKELNGFQMHADKNLDECIKMTRNQVEIDYLVNKGYSKAGAFCIVNNIKDVEMVKAVEQIFNN